MPHTFVFGEELHKVRKCIAVPLYQGQFLVAGSRVIVDGRGRRCSYLDPKC